MNEQLQIKLENLPSDPGVYQFKDERGSILYVGKAKKLKNRVRSYFQDSRYHDGRLKNMIRRIADMEVFVTDSEAEALMLEYNLIKEHQPRYNIMYRDDKSYPYICVTQSERPRVFPTRTVVKDGSKYYGPYDSVVKMKRMLETIAATFDLCSCACSSRTVDRTRNLPKWGTCFGAYLGQCSERLGLEEYQARIKKIDRLLQGRTQILIRELKEEMDLASKALEFEEAARIRDGLEGMQRYSDNMKMVSSDLVDRDVFVVELEREDNIGCGVLFRVREGKVVGKIHKFIRDVDGIDKEELLQTFMEDYYTSAISMSIPDEVFIGNELENDEPLAQFLWQEHGKKVPLIQPKIGEKAQLLRLAESNGRHKIREWQLQKMKEEKDRIPHSVQALQRDLNLSFLPRRIECFDNSNFQGSDPVASMVCFVDAQPRKSEYKRFTIKTVQGPDDFASMREILTRRYSRVKNEKLQAPDLIVVDGGKGQLSSAVEALKQIDFYDKVTIIGLAKRLEEVFFPGESQSVMIPKTSSSLKLLQRIRDEAHRFAITYHRQKRSKRTITSELYEIPGIGKKTAELLLKQFGSVTGVINAKREELTALIGKSRADKVQNYFQVEDS